MVTSEVWFAWKFMKNINLKTYLTFSIINRTHLVNLLGFSPVLFYPFQTQLNTLTINFTTTNPYIQLFYKLSIIFILKHKKIPKDFSLDISALFLFIIETEKEEKGQKRTVPVCPFSFNLSVAHRLNCVPLLERTR